MDYIFISEGTRGQTIALEATPPMKSGNFLTGIANAFMETGQRYEGDWRPAHPKNEPRVLSGASGKYLFGKIGGTPALFLVYDYGGNGKNTIAAVLSLPNGNTLVPGAKGMGYISRDGLSFLKTLKPQFWTSLPKVAYAVLQPQYDLSRVWVGVGGKVGVGAALPGVGGGRGELMMAAVMNLSARQVAFIVATTDLVAGGGAGLSAGVSVFIATGKSKAQELVGLGVGGDDINICIGENWGKFLDYLMRADRFGAMLSHLPKGLLSRSLRTIQSIRTAGETIGNNEGWMTWAKTLITVSGIDGTDPSLSVWDTPLSDGLELSMVSMNGKVVYAGDAIDEAVIGKFAKSASATPSLPPNWQHPSTNWKRPGEM